MAVLHGRQKRSNQCRLFKCFDVLDRWGGEEFFIFKLRLLAK